MNRVMDAKGYVRIKLRNHPNAKSDGYIFEHTLVASQALGRALPPGVVVHHHDQIKHNNSNDNLVICENDSYHHWLHRRMGVVAKGGDPNTQSYCGKCKRVKQLGEFGIYRTGKSAGFPRGYCIECARATTQAWRDSRKEVSL